MCPGRCEPPYLKKSKISNKLAKILGTVQILLVFMGKKQRLARLTQRRRRGASLMCVNALIIH